MFSIHKEAKDFFKHELDNIISHQVWDSHVHVSYSVPEFKPGGGLKPGEDCTHATISEWDGKLLPGRQMSYSFVGHPYKGVDAEKMGNYTIQQAEAFNKEHRDEDVTAAAFPVVSPELKETTIEQFATHPLVAGFKPYRFMSSTGEVDECSITDFLPEHQIEVANTYGLIILLHMSKRMGPLDPDNLRDLQRLTAKYPGVKWQLAHCARSFNPIFLERSISTLKQIPNLWYDTSAVCEPEVFDILFSEIPVERILYGSDHNPPHVDGGKYIAFGKAWMWLHPGTADLNLTHCDPRPFPMVYEELRAMKNAMQNAGYGKGEKEAIFYTNTKELIQAVLSGKH